MIPFSWSKNIAGWDKLNAYLIFGLDNVCA